MEPGLKKESAGVEKVTAELYCEVPQIMLYVSIHHPLYKSKIHVTSAVTNHPLLTGGQQAVSAGGSLGSRRSFCPDPVPPPDPKSKPQGCRSLHLQR